MPALEWGDKPSLIGHGIYRFCPKGEDFAFVPPLSVDIKRNGAFDAFIRHCPVIKEVFGESFGGYPRIKKKGARWFFEEGRAEHFFEGEDVPVRLLIGLLLARLRQHSLGGSLSFDHWRIAKGMMGVLKRCWMVDDLDVVYPQGGIFEGLARDPEQMAILLGVRQVLLDDCRRGILSDGRIRLEVEECGGSLVVAAMEYARTGCRDIVETRISSGWFDRPALDPSSVRYLITCVHHSLDDLLLSCTIDDQGGAILRKALRQRRPILVFGNRSSGKSTLLLALAGLLADDFRLHVSVHDRETRVRDACFVRGPCTAHEILGMAGDTWLIRHGAQDILSTDIDFLDVGVGGLFAIRGRIEAEFHHAFPGFWGCRVLRHRPLAVELSCHRVRRMGTLEEHGGCLYLSAP